MTQRDSFWGEIVRVGYDDGDIMILTADSGAPAFDNFRKDRPNQFIHCGISEASMITAAAGLSLSGKKVYCYAIVPFITGRVFDQIKVAIALRGLPVCLVSVGTGFSYDNGGPTHFGVEDIGIMKNLKGIEIWSPSDAMCAKHVARFCLRNPAFRYVRLDRHVFQARWDFIEDFDDIADFEGSFNWVNTDLHNPSGLLISYGALRETAMKLAKEKNLIMQELVRVHPLPAQFLNGWTWDQVISLEEHFLSGGIGESISSFLHDHGYKTPFIRYGLPDRYEWENGSREYLWQRAGIDEKTLRACLT